MSKKVLIICYYWPPAGGPGVQRWLKFVKYLPEFGITPIVYVPDNPSYPITDNTLLNEVPERIKVIKQPIKEPYKLSSMLSRKHTNTLSSGILPKKGKRFLLQRLMLYIRGNFFIPDARVQWVKPSVSYLKDVIHNESIDTIITTGPPHSLHLIGKSLKEARGNDLRWIADFRDPWTTIGYHDKLSMTAKTKAKHQRLEQDVLQTADEIIVTSPTTKSDFENTTTKPITVITNGYDTEISLGKNLNKDFILTHIGSLLSERNPIALWRVLSQLIESDHVFKQCFKLKLAGTISQEVIDSITKFGLVDYLEILGYVPHKEALILQRQSSVLLLIEIDAKITKGIIPGKVFEYLAAQRPILALGPKNADVSAIITNAKAGYYAHYDEEEVLRGLIMKLFNNYTSQAWQETTEAIAPYHRRNLTEQLVKIINN